MHEDEPRSEAEARPPREVDKGKGAIPRLVAPFELAGRFQAWTRYKLGRWGRIARSLFRSPRRPPRG